MIKPLACHCEEQRDEAISFFTVRREIAALPLVARNDTWWGWKIAALPLVARNDTP